MEQRAQPRPGTAAALPTREATLHVAAKSRVRSWPGIFRLGENVPLGVASSKLPGVSVLALRSQKAGGRLSTANAL